MREPSEDRVHKCKPSTGKEKEGFLRAVKSRSGSSTKSRIETERRIYVPNTPTRSTKVTGRLNDPSSRFQSTPNKSRSDNVSRPIHGALAKKSPARGSSRSKVGLSLNFRKGSKGPNSLKSSRNIDTNSTNSIKCSTTNSGPLVGSQMVDQKTSATEKFIGQSSTDNEKKRVTRNTSTGRTRFGLALSFRKGSKSQTDDKCRSPRSEDTQQSKKLTKSIGSLSDMKFSDVPWLNENLKDVMAENVSLKEQIKLLEKEMKTFKIESRSNIEVLSPLMYNTNPLTSAVLDETTDYSLFDVSQCHDLANLQEQVSKLQEHNVSTNEELQATLEELKDLRVKSLDLHLENQSLVGERKLLCESLCQQSERAQRFEQEMEILKNLILSNLDNPDDYQRRLAEIHRLVDLDRETIMSQFSLLKENLNETELELNETKEKILRLREDRGRWKTKYEHLKQLHAGYSSKLSSKSLSDQENRPPRSLVNESDWKARCYKLEVEVEGLKELVKFLELKNNTNEDEVAIAALKAEKEAAQTEVLSLRSKMVKDRHSWEGFQADLLTAVRVAEAFREAAEDDSKRLAVDNENLHSEIALLRKQVEKLRRSGFGLITCPPLVSNSSVKAMVHTLESRIREYGAVVPGESGRSNSSSGSLCRNRQFSVVKSADFTKVRDLTSDKIDRGTQEKEDTRTFERSGDSAASVAKSFGTNDDDWFREPLSTLMNNGGSRRNALLRWCQRQTFGYKDVEITNFSSSWTDGLALCALIHSYRPDLIPYKDMSALDREKNLRFAFNIIDELGIERCSNSPEDLAACERPDWNRVMRLVTRIFCHFESSQRNRKTSSSKPASALRQTFV